MPFDEMSITQRAAYIIQELFNFDGQVEELCAMSETEGEFGIESAVMVDTLKQFIAENL